MLNKIIFKQNKNSKSCPAPVPCKIQLKATQSKQIIIIKLYIISIHTSQSLKNYCIWESYNEVMIVCYDMQTHEWTLSKYKEEYL